MDGQYIIFKRLYYKEKAVLGKYVIDGHFDQMRLNQNWNSRFLLERSIDIVSSLPKLFPMCSENTRGIKTLQRTTQ